MALAQAILEYVNKDINGNPVYDKVPLANTVVTIVNQFATGQAVYVEGERDGQFVDSLGLADNQLQLDSMGEALYTFSAGYPNIVEPYTLGLNIKYNTNGQDLEWSENSTFKAIVLGELPSGNNLTRSIPMLSQVAKVDINKLIDINDQKFDTEKDNTYTLTPLDNETFSLVNQ